MLPADVALTVTDQGAGSASGSGGTTYMVLVASVGSASGGGATTTEWAEFAVPSNALGAPFFENDGTAPVTLSKRWISTFAYPDTAGRSQQHRRAGQQLYTFCGYSGRDDRCNPGKRSRPSPLPSSSSPLRWDCWDPAGDGGGWRRKRNARRGSPRNKSYGRTLVRRGGRRSAPQPNRGSLTWNWLQLGGGAFSTPLFSSGSLAATPAGDGILSLDRYMWLAGEPSDITATPEPSTLVLLAVSTIGLLAYGWRRRQAA